MSAEISSNRSPRISILTSVYNTNPQFMQEAAESVFGQTYLNYEWIICDNGSTKSKVIDTVEGLARYPQVNMSRLQNNLGIIGGMRNCFDRAMGDYVVPMDSDDLLDPDALKILADAIAANNYPAFIYSDEDVLIDGKPIYPYRRPDWDPVLNICTSYIWHLTAFRLDLAKKLGVYADDSASHCHDWDTVMKFRSAGLEIVHIPQTLYHWRSHQESSTNKGEPDPQSLRSQRYVLERELNRLSLSELFEITIFPINRGAPELWVKRIEKYPEAIYLVLQDGNLGECKFRKEMITERAGYPFASAITIAHEEQTEKDGTTTHVLANTLLQQLKTLSEASSEEAGLVAFISEKIMPLGNIWPWEAIGLKRLHPDTVMFSCRVLDPKQSVIGGGEFVDGHGSVNHPYYGLHADNPGYYALALKQQSVSGVCPEFFIVDLDFLRRVLAASSNMLDWNSLAELLAGKAREDGKRIIFSPLISGQMIDASKEG